MHPTDVKTLIEKAMARTRTPFRGIIAQVNNAPDNQLIQMTGTNGETLPDVEMVQHFGFSSMPPAGTQCIVIALGGKTGHGIILGTENGGLRFKPLKSGEAVMFNAFGDYVVMHDDRVTEINCKQLLVKASEKVRFETPLIEATDDAKFGGQVDVDKDINSKANVQAAGDIKDADGDFSMSGMRNKYNGHHHKDDDPQPTAQM